MDERKQQQLDLASTMKASIRIALRRPGSDAVETKAYALLTTEEIGTAESGAVFAINYREPSKIVTEPIAKDTRGFKLTEPLVAAAVDRALNRFEIGDYNRGSDYERPIPTFAVEQDAIERQVQRAKDIGARIEVALRFDDNDDWGEHIPYSELTIEKLAASKNGIVQVIGSLPSRSVTLSIQGQPTAIGVFELVDRAIAQFARGGYTGRAGYTGVAT